MRQIGVFATRVAVGPAGPDAATFSRLIQSESGRHLLGAGLRWTPLDFGAICLRIAASEARARNSLAGHELSASVAPQDAEGAFSG